MFTFTKFVCLCVCFFVCVCVVCVVYVCVCVCVFFSSGEVYIHVYMMYFSYFAGKQDSFIAVIK